MNKSCIITGASRGIGRGTALALAKRGANIIINYKENSAAAEKTAEEVRGLGAIAETFCADVSNEAEALALCDFAAKKFGKIDALVNNAGIALSQQPFDLTTPSDWEKVFSVNVFGMMNCTKAVLPYMIHQKAGSIVNLSSVWGITGGSCEAVYSASKAAVIGFSKAMAKELAPSGIRVNSVAPGIINTDMNKHLSEEDIKATEREIGAQRLGTAEEIGEIAAFLCLDESRYITGEIIKADGGWF